MKVNELTFVDISNTMAVEIVKEVFINRGRNCGDYTTVIAHTFPLSFIEPLFYTHEILVFLKFTMCFLGQGIREEALITLDRQSSLILEHHWCISAEITARNQSGIIALLCQDLDARDF